MFLLIDILDSVIHTSCCWDECVEIESEGYVDPSINIFPKYDAPIDSGSQYGPLSVQRRLQERYQLWKEELEASQFVLDIITDGYKLPFSVSTAYGGRESSLSIGACQFC